MPTFKGTKDDLELAKAARKGKTKAKLSTVRLSIFDKILADAIRSGRTGENVIKSAQWYRNKAKALGKGTKPADIKKERDRFRARAVYGRMFFFAYDPKHKKKLPYYDRFPLVFPLQAAKGGFLGLNFHYLPWRERSILMDELISALNNKRFDETTRLIISYDILQRASKTGNYIPCIKHYLKDHVRSQFIRVEAVEWNIALMLPVAQFKKASERKVWMDSRKKILKYR